MPARSSPRCSPDHSRSRGVYDQRSAFRTSSSGSSPLARGLPPRRPGRPVGGRIIPARAGFTGAGGEQAAALEDHPRSRGVYPNPSPGRAPAPGSSPLARGLPTPSLDTISASRIIPARAGFTALVVHRPGDRRDHPRSRGVYWTTCPRARRRPGSSPLARGLLPAPGAARRRLRIIPARAGFTACRPGPPSAPVDHPRSRGVYELIERRAGLIEGSSPLARGLPREESLDSQISGIIPARAGFTDSPTVLSPDTPDHPRSRGVYPHERAGDDPPMGSSPLARGLPTTTPPGATRRMDHPRSRGVYCSQSTPAARRTGSSPLARGLHHVPGENAVRLRIIPARAGFTQAESFGHRRARDHPRSRGVYAPDGGIVAEARGSSPLARGLPAGRRHGSSFRGIIPARAGFTSTAGPITTC